MLRVLSSLAAGRRLADNIAELARQRFADEILERIPFRGKRCFDLTDTPNLAGSRQLKGPFNGVSGPIDFHLILPVSLGSRSERTVSVQQPRQGLILRAMRLSIKE